MPQAQPLIRPRAPWTRVLLALLCAWALLMIVPDLYRVFDPLASFGVAVDNDGLVIDVKGPFAKVSDSPAFKAGLRAGDRVDLQAMRCIPLERAECRSLIAVLGGLGGPRVALPGRVIDLIVQSAGGGSKRVTLEARRYAASFGDRLVLLADTLVGIAVVVTAFLLVWTRPARMTWGFFLYSIWFNPGQTFAYYALLTFPPAVLAQGALEAMAQAGAYGGLLVFALCFPAEAIDPRWVGFRWAIALIAGALGLLQLASYGALLGVPSDMIALIAFVAGFGVDALVLAILFERRRTLPPRDRQRIVWVIAGCAIGIPAFIVAEIAQSTSLSRHFIPLLNSGQIIGVLYLLNAALTYFVAQAVWRRRVVSVGIPLRRGTVLMLLGLAVAIPFVELHDMLEHLEEALDQPEWVWALVIAPMALLALNRLHELAVELADRLFNRRFHSARRQLQEAGQRLERAVSEADIERVLVNAPISALSVASAALFRRQADQLQLHAHSESFNVAAWRDPLPDGGSFALRALETGVAVRVPYAADADCSVDEPCIAIPVGSSALGQIAVVLYGSHENGNDIDADECELLSTLATHAVEGYLLVEVARLRRETVELRARLTALELPT